MKTSIRRVLIVALACSVWVACETLEDALESTQLRLQLVSSQIADAEGGSIGSEGFYNDGEGYPLPGDPEGDSALAFNSEGQAPGRGVFSLSPQVPYWRSVRGDDRIICLEGRGRSEANLAGHATLRPASFDVPFPAQPVSSTLLMTLAVEEGSTARILLRKGGFAPRAGVRESLSRDALVLEISEGAVWSRLIGQRFTHSSDRRRLFDFPMQPAVSGGDLLASNITAELNAEAGICTVTLGGARDAITDDRYCAPSDHRDLEIGISVVRDDVQQGQSFSYTCLTTALYTSRRS